MIASVHRRSLASLLVIAFAALPIGRASAQAALIDGLGGTADYGADGQCLSPNDDGSSAGIDITPYFPGGLRFFDQVHDRVFVNTNGNITFSERAGQFTPDPFPVANQPMIAPFWADVDIRNTGGSCMGSSGLTCSVCEPCHDPSENGVWWHLKEGRMIVTWDQVGRFSCQNDKRASFQLILTAVEGCGGDATDFDVEFRFNRCEWEVGTASGDANEDGFCQPGEHFYDLLLNRHDCTPAQAGFDAGNETDYVTIAGSREPGIAARLCSESNVDEQGVWRFEIRGGAVVCPGAAEACDTGMMGVCAEGRTNCVGMGTECVPDVAASEERCDALDNDCDGSVDEGDSICPRAGQICEQGACLAPCFELGCPAGQTCTDRGICIDSECEGVSCPEGQRCSAGGCVGACEGIECPAALQCRGGRCVDLCEGLTCDDCTVCVEGACEPRCDLSACPAGQSCEADGRCVEEACAGVSCDEGTVCSGGSCVDACEGALCPPGEECELGRCVQVFAPDAGPAPPRDAGPPAGFDGGPVGEGFDAGSSSTSDAGVDAGRSGPPPRRGASCACRASGRRDAGAAGSGLVALALGLIVRRRSRRRGH